MLEKQAIYKLVDPSLRNCYVDQEVYRMLQCSSLCIGRDPHLRPRMSQVGKSIKITFPSYHFSILMLILVTRLYSGSCILLYVGAEDAGR